MQFPIEKKVDLHNDSTRNKINYLHIKRKLVLQGVYWVYCILIPPSYMGLYTKGGPNLT